MESKKLKRDLVILLVSSFIVIVCWIGFNIYSRATTSTIDESLTKQIAPIQPSFDTATINSLTEREKIMPLYQSEGLPSPNPEVAIEDTPTPTPFNTGAEIPDETQSQSIPPQTDVPIASGGAAFP